MIPQYHMTPKLRPIIPQYHETIALWLSALAGAQSEQLLAWLRGVANLDQPKPVLVLQGAPCSGKSLLIRGIGRLWSKQYLLEPETLDAHFQRYNEVPVHYCDDLPPALSVLRQAISLAESENVVVHRPYFRDDLVGRVRVVFEQRDPVWAALCGLDVVTCQSAGRAYLDALSPVEISSWIEEDKIAAHVLALG